MSNEEGWVIAYISLGSNLGDREALLRRALGLLEELPGVELLEVSRLFETDPVGPPPQDDYLNAAARIRCRLSPRELLEQLLEIERQCGRTRGAGSPRWLARPLDLDLLLFGDRCIDEVGLEVPHPRLHERPFVLAPLCDVGADEVHPRLGLTVRQLAEEAGDRGVRAWHEASGS